MWCVNCCLSDHFINFIAINFISLINFLKFLIYLLNFKSNLNFYYSIKIFQFKDDFIILIKPLRVHSFITLPYFLSYFIFYLIIHF